MLLSFNIQNFRSILELKLDFSYGEGKAPNGYQDQEIMPFLETTGKKRLVPCMAFFGANASGKTNILKALAILDDMVLKGIPLSEAYEPNLLNTKFSDTTFALEFTHGDDCLAYEITYNSKGVSLESLKKNGKEIYNIQKLKPEFAPRIRSATYSNEKLSEILNVECSDGDGHQTKLFLHIIGKAYLGLNPDLKNAFNFFSRKLLHLLDRDSVPLPVAVEILGKDLEGDEIAALREITDVVRRLDIDILEIGINQKKLEGEETPRRGLIKFNSETGEKHSVQITTKHTDADGRPVLFDFFKHESAGTQQLAGLVGLMLHTLKTGGILLVDELECSLHPLLMREIALLFKQRSHNTEGAQLIFTTHNTDILDDSILRISEIAMVRKTTANGTLVRRLVEAKKDGEDIRNVTNFRKQYLAGFYSGVPHPAL